MRKYWRVLAFLLFGILMGLTHYRNHWLNWGVGFGLALVIILVDRMLYAWWLKPFEQLSIQIQYWCKRGDFLAVAQLLYKRGQEQTRLVLRSMGFALVWPFLMVYVITSTGSVIAAAIVMVLGLDLAIALLSDWKHPDVLASWYGWQIKRSLSTKEIKTATVGFLIVWSIATLLFLVR